MPIDPDRLCRCHGQPMYRATDRGGTRWACLVKLRARNTRWNATPERKAQRAAYNRAHMIKIGEHYVGYARSAEQATAIRAHIKERLRVFKQGQFVGAAVEVPSPVGVPVQAGSGADLIRGKSPAAGDHEVEGRQVRPQSPRRLRVRHRGAVR